MASYLRSVAKRACAATLFGLPGWGLGQGSTLEVGAAFAALGRGPPGFFSAPSGSGQQHPFRAPQRVQRIDFVSMSSRCRWASSWVQS